MTKDEVIQLAKEAAAKHGHTLKQQPNDAVIEVIAEVYAMGALAERERIKEANAPEIEKINDLVKELERAVTKEREACARIVEANAEVCFHGSTMHRVLEKNAELIRARGSK